MMDFFTGKLQDLGLKFSHETLKVAAGGLGYKRIFYFVFYIRKTSFNLLKRLNILSILLQLDMNRFQYDFLTL